MKTKYTPHNVNAILNALRTGAKRTKACKMVNIHKDTFYEWLKVHADFSDQVRDAEQEYEDGLVQVAVGGIDEWENPTLEQRKYVLSLLERDRYRHLGFTKTKEQQEEMLQAATEVSGLLRQVLEKEEQNGSTEETE